MQSVQCYAYCNYSVFKMNRSVTFEQNAAWGRRGLLALTVACAVAAPAAIAATVPALQAVPSVDLPRYQGQWYQIAHYANTFQKQCVSNTTANYELMSTGMVTVTNACKKADGTTSTAIGQARVKQPRVLGLPSGTPVTSKLEVRFAPSWLSWVPGVWANYWVIQLADDYRYAVIGEPNRQFLWILSRTPTLSPQDRANINTQLLLQGYDPTKLLEEPQL